MEHSTSDERDDIAEDFNHSELDQSAERNDRLTEDCEFPMWNIWKVP
jgi:hypothetical protein